MISQAHDRLPTMKSFNATHLKEVIMLFLRLGTTAFGLYPVLLPASTDPAYSLTVHNAAAKPYALNVGLHWWIIGVLLALGYGTYLHIAFRGKVAAPVAEEGY